MKGFTPSPFLWLTACVVLFTDARRIIPSSLEQRQQHDVVGRGNRHLDQGNHTARLVQVDVDIPSSPDGHIVKDLPLLAEGELNVRHWAGHLPASSQRDKYFFYWLFAPDGDFDPETVPLIIWLNGGPGCSSMDGLFLENGPFRLVKDASGGFSLKAEPNSWHKAPAYTLYIDQPVGTGLSFTTSKKYPGNDEEVNIDFYYFLQSFYKLHGDKFVRDGVARTPLYFSGESHAGHFIPHMMNYILKRNDDLKSGNVRVNLAGAAIGNGWTGKFALNGSAALDAYS